MLSDDKNPMADTYRVRGARHAEHSIALHGFPVTRWNGKAMVRQGVDNPHYLAGYFDALILCATAQA